MSCGGHGYREREREKEVTHRDFNRTLYPQNMEVYNKTTDVIDAAVDKLKKQLDSAHRMPCYVISAVVSVVVLTVCCVIVLVAFAVRKYFCAGTGQRVVVVMEKTNDTDTDTDPCIAGEGVAPVETSSTKQDTQATIAHGGKCKHARRSLPFKKRAQSTSPANFDMEL